MKIILTIAYFFFFSCLAICQQVNAYTEKGLALIDYTVPKGQGLQAIATMYDIKPAELLAINQLKANAVLKDGQTIKVPIAKAIQSSCKQGGCVKVYHTVRQSEGLYRIGVNYGNIKVAQLKTLNNLQGESVSLGQRLLVGYLPERLVGASLSNVPDVQDVATAPTVNPAQEVEAAAVETPQTLPQQQAATKPTPMPEVKKTGKPAEPLDTTLLRYKGRGVFEGQYIPGTPSTSMMAASFKTDSGWEDGKFYVLADGIPQGTVIKVSDPATGKYVFAKVLGGLPQLKKTETISLRISVAGAVALGIRTAGNFEVVVD